MMNANPGISEPGTLVKPARQAIPFLVFALRSNLLKPQV
jgi:hypothetical protein